MPVLSVTLRFVTNPKKFSLPIQLTAITIGRLFLNTGLRMMYPFAPAMARGLGVDITAIYNLITLRSLAGFLGPLFGPLSEKYGRKPVIVGAILLLSLGCGVVVIWPSYWALGVTLSTIGIAKVIFDPAMQSYLGETVPYQQRGKALSITELAWSGGFIVGAPLVGLTIDRFGWQSPFAWMAVLSLGAVAALWWVLPYHKPQSGKTADLRHTLHTMHQYPVIWAVAIYTMLVMVANEVFLINYGDWMESSFQLNLTNLGLASGVIGAAEVTGELLAGWSVDRFGKRPIVIVLGLLTAVVYFLFPYFSITLNNTLVMLFILFLFFEISVVGGIPLLTEVVPTARSVVLSMSIAFGALGRTIGSQLGPRIAQQFGFSANGLIAAVVMAVATLILARWIREAVAGKKGDLRVEIGD